MVLNDMTLYGMQVPLLEMVPCRIVSLCILLVIYGMYSLCIVAGVYYCNGHELGILLHIFVKSRGCNNIDSRV